MAGGIDWFRWHHGSVTDPKLGLIARRSGTSVAAVIAFWAYLLEAASMASDRGNPGTPDFEATDFALGLDEGISQRIYLHMSERGLIADGRIAAWEKRQPKRERDDDSSTDRVRAFRERQVASRNADETPRNADETSGTPRGEESREEESSSGLRPEARKRAARKCPESFIVSSSLKAWASEKAQGVCLEAETEKFKDYTFKNPMTDWDGAWRNWMRRAAERVTPDDSKAKERFL